MTYDAMGKRDDAVRCYREVLALGPDDDVRDRAREFLARPYGQAPAAAARTAAR